MNAPTPAPAHLELPDALPEAFHAVITGANTGLGLAAATAMIERGATVTIASRNPQRVDDAVRALNSTGARGMARAGIVDLGSLASVETFAERFVEDHDRLNLLVNNAGIMVPPPGQTNDGFETQFGVNFVGHFALTGRLFGLLDRTPGSRVVTMSSIGHRGAAIDFDNLALDKPYDPWREYGQSKLADLIFALELHRRVEVSGSDVASLGAHPGVSESELVRHLPGRPPAGTEFMSTEQGVMSTLTAALSPVATSGQYWGPDGPGEAKGWPALASVDPAAADPDTARRLWEWAQEATGVAFP